MEMMSCLRWLLIFEGAYGSPHVHSPQTIRRVLAQFVGKIRQGVDSEGIEFLGNGNELAVNGRVLHRAEVGLVHKGIVSGLSSIADAEDNVRLRVCGSRCEVREGTDQGLNFRLRVVDPPSPVRSKLESLHVDTGYDPEIISSTFQSLEEVGVGRGVGVNDLSRGEDNLEVLHVVASPASRRREVRDTAYDRPVSGRQKGTKPETNLQSKSPPRQYPKLDLRSRQGSSDQGFLKR